MVGGIMKREPTKVDIMRVIAEAVAEFDQSDKEHDEIEAVYSDEAEVLEIRVLYPHYVYIYSVTVKYETSFSG
jgi:hypothetical protein